MNALALRTDTRPLVESLFCRAEAARILNDSSAPADLFAAAFIILWNGNWETGLLAGPWDECLTDSLSDRRAFSNEAAEEIVPRALLRMPDRIEDRSTAKTLLFPSFQVGRSCLEYFSQVRVSEHVIAKVVKGLWHGVGASARAEAGQKLPGIALALATRVRVQAAKRTTEGMVTASTAIRLLELVYKRPAWWRRSYPAWAPAPADDVLPDVLKEVLPQTSSVLVNRAIELAALGHKRLQTQIIKEAGRESEDPKVVKLHSWALNAACHLPSAEVWSEAAVDQLLTLNAEVVDTELGRNPRLTDAQKWRIYARYHDKGKAYTAGRILAQWADVRKQIERSGDSHAAAGVCARACQADPRGKWLTPGLGVLALRSPYVTTKDSHTGVASIVYGELLSYLYRHLPQDDLVAALPQGDTSMVLALVAAWKQSPKDGPLLKALLRYPFASPFRVVQWEFLLKSQDPSHFPVDPPRLSAPEIHRYRGERRRLYREVVLPQLCHSKFQVVRARASKLTSGLVRLEAKAVDAVST